MRRSGQRRADKTAHEKADEADLSYVGDMERNNPRYPAADAQDVQHLARCIFARAQAHHHSQRLCDIYLARIVHDAECSQGSERCQIHDVHRAVFNVHFPTASELHNRAQARHGRYRRLDSDDS